MRRVWGKVASALTAAALALPGCSSPMGQRSQSVAEVEQLRYKYANLNLENAAVETPLNHPNAATIAPISLDAENPEYWDMPLEQALQSALQNSRVLRDLGGLILRSPQTVRTQQDPAITETDPRFGVEAALSAYDAQFAASAFHEKNDRALNNVFFGGGTRLLEQDASAVQAQLSKTSAGGTRYILRNETNYDANNAPGNAFPSAWTTIMDMEVRQPLLLGAGVNFNRIAGNSNTPGVYSGVLVARVNTDISLAEFEQGVRNFVSDVENAYWDLYFAYRDLDSKVAARDAALETWRKISPQVQAGRLPAEQEALAREQYFRLHEEVQNALTGKLVEGTRINNGSSGGTFRGNGGVYLAERRLRLLMGLPINDGRTIRPCDEPAKAQIVFSWDDVITEAVSRRVELRRTRWQVKRRELELEASRKFLLPTLDLVGRYRWRGFGRDLLQNDSDKTNPLDASGNVTPGPYFGDAFSNLTEGEFQEWQLGAEFSMQLGARRGHSAVRNAELLLARERTLLCEQEREVVHDLSNAIADLERAWKVVQTNYNRRVAAKEQLEALTATEGYERDSAKLFVVLESQRRLAEAENTYYRSLVEYNLAIKNVHFEKGSLLDYNGVFLQEGGWPAKAYDDAEERWDLRSAPLDNDLQELVEYPKVVTQGAYMQLLIKEGQVPTGTPLADAVELPQAPPQEEPAQQHAQPQAPLPQEPLKNAAEATVDIPVSYESIEAESEGLPGRLENLRSPAEGVLPTDEGPPAIDSYESP